MTLADVLPVSVPESDLTSWQATRVRIVHDPELGEVLVRWLYLTGNLQTAPRWRCSGCGARGSLANACPHIFAAAIHLAEEVLGLNAIGVTAAPEPPPDDLAEIG